MVEALTCGVMCQESLRLRRWTGEPWATGLSTETAKRYGKKMIRLSYQKRSQNETI